jgi:hypothetical protein
VRFCEAIRRGIGDAEKRLAGRKEGFFVVGWTTYRPRSASSLLILFRAIPNDLKGETDV